MIRFVQGKHLKSLDNSSKTNISIFGGGSGHRQLYSGLSFDCIQGSVLVAQGEIACSSKIGVGPYAKQVSLNFLLQIICFGPCLVPQNLLLDLFSDPGSVQGGNKGCQELNPDQSQARHGNLLAVLLLCSINILLLNTKYTFFFILLNKNAITEAGESIASRACALVMVNLVSTPDTPNGHLKTPKSNA